tara:strand:- start:276 stop:1265 length:990 start_codon:yes stop_codon:yes gene_type:complete
MNSLKTKMLEKPNQKHGRTRGESTITTYMNLIRLTFERLNPELKIENIEFLLDSHKVHLYLDQFPSGTQNNYLSAFVAVLEVCDLQLDSALIDGYRERLIENIKDIKKIRLEQKKSIVEEENWTSLEALQKVATDYKKQLTKLKVWKKNEENLTREERELLKYWLIAELYTADPINNPPLRADYCNMKIVKYDDFINFTGEELQSNYLVIKSSHKKFISLGNYKTANIYGVKNIPIGKVLNKVLNAFLKLHTKEYLLYTCSQKRVLSANAMGHLLKRVFMPTGKKISINMLRHIVISEFDTGPPIKEKEALAEKMCHSTNMQQLYVKHD